MGKEGPMDVDDPEPVNGPSPVLKENGLVLIPVSPQEGGEGLPYAPVDWPNPGDTWGWRVGKRTTISGYYCDRYLYLPPTLQKSRRGKDGFASRLSIKQYIQGRFPGADVESFFASFSWRIPSKQAFLVKDHTSSSCMLSDDISEPFDCQNSGPACKAGNRQCPSLTEEENVSAGGTTMFCDICCGEPDFCRECCCILCCKTIDLAVGGYSFFRCQAKARDGLACGHAAHMICALRSYLAGSVGGTIGLDAEYYCRRCDSRTELTEHVTNIFKLCESAESPEDNKKMLELVVCLLRGSLKKNVKRLYNRAELVLEKIESGNVLTDIGKLEDDISTVKIAEAEDNVVDSGKQTPPQASIGLHIERKKLNEEIDQVLQELRASQQYEYKIAQKRLLAQRDLLVQLYQQPLDKDKSELVQRRPPSTSIIQTKEKIKREMKKLKDMEMVGKGFGRTPKDIIDEYFDLNH